MASKVTSTILISATGRRGSDGTQSWATPVTGEHRSGCHGRHGRHAEPPTPGGRGGGVELIVKGPSADGSILLERIDRGSVSETPLTVSPTQDLLVDCRGGAGGRGGIGEDGQPGDSGQIGSHASISCDATSGGPGGDGGDAGQGTSGAKGGDGGRVCATVGEEDMDTLLALRWNVDGGAGGTKGRHGRPGAGGAGGPGGQGYTWTEAHSRSWTGSNNETVTETYGTTHTRPSGGSGQNGRRGGACGLPLSDGQWGADGHCEIRLRRKGREEDEVYSDRYHLMLRSFDIVDENEDGINEPGEFLIVQNVLIENIGEMPSPRVHPLYISIKKTSWLNPDKHQQLQIPLDIQPRAVVRIAGSLRALIRNEHHQRPSGVAFREEDTVTLQAFSPRLKRRVLEFKGSRQVVYGYPLVIEQPKFLDAVAFGDRVKFSWQVKNKSLKPIGNATTPRRRVCSRISSPEGTFTLMSQSDGKEETAPQDVHCAVEELEGVQPGGCIVVCQYLAASAAAKAFSVGAIKVQLCLADPHKTDPNSARMVVHFDLNIQVSPRYRYNPLANFLVVVNCEIERQNILHLMDVIEHILHLRADILNLSLVGSLNELGEKGHSSLLSRYKTVIIYTNSFAYFQDGTRNAWALMDPWEVSQLATEGTSFLLLSPESDKTELEPLKRWLRQVVLPARELSQTLLRDTSVKKPKEIVGQLEALRPGADAPDDENGASPTLVVKRGIIRSLDSKAASKAKSVQRMLSKQLPLRRFVVSPVVDPSVPKQGTVATSEGLPHKAQVVIFNSPDGPATQAHRSLITAMVVLSIPYPARCRIFWNMVTAGDAPDTSMSIQTAYGGEDVRDLLGKDRLISFQENNMLGSQVLELVTWSITNQITPEISKFCHKAPWRDRLSDTYMLSQLSLLVTFLDTAPPPSYSPLSNESLEILNAVLAPALAVSAPISLGNLLRQNVFRIRNRKHKTRKVLHDVLKKLFDNLYAYGPDEHRKLTKAKAAAQKMLSKEEGAAKQVLARIKKENSAFTALDRARWFCHRRLEDIANVPRGTSDFADLGDLAGVETRSVCMSKDELNEKRRQYKEHLARMKSDAALSKRMLFDMVT